MNNLVNDKKFLIVGAIAVVLIVCYLIDQHIKNTVKHELKQHYNMKRKVKNKLMKQKQQQQQRERNTQMQRQQEPEQYQDEQIDMDSYVDPVNNTHNEYEYDNQSERLKADNMYMRDIMDDL